MPKGEMNVPASERSTITRKVQTNQGLAVVSDQVEMPSTCAAPFFDFKNFKVRRGRASSTARICPERPARRPRQIFDWEEGTTYDMAVGAPMYPPPPSRLNPPRETPAPRSTDMAIDVMVEDFENGTTSKLPTAPSPVGPRVIMAQPPERVREAYKRASARAKHLGDVVQSPSREGADGETDEKSDTPTHPPTPLL